MPTIFAGCNSTKVTVIAVRVFLTSFCNTPITAIVKYLTPDLKYCFSVFFFLLILYYVGFKGLYDIKFGHTILCKVAFKRERAREKDCGKVWRGKRFS